MDVYELYVIIKQIKYVGQVFSNVREHQRMFTIVRACSPIFVDVGVCLCDCVNVCERL